MGGCCLKASNTDGFEASARRPAAYVVTGGVEKVPPDTHSFAKVKQILSGARPDVTADYILGRVLGRGRFGVIRLAESKVSAEKFACKTISKRKLISLEDIEDVRREVEIMYHLKGDKNIVQLEGVYEDRNAVHLVMEYCAGGELFDRIVTKGHYTEKDAAAVCRTIVKVVAYCHKMAVVHRDLKPENFLLTDASENAQLKCTDFGLSVFAEPGQVLTDIVGSPYYVAPEVLKQHYSQEADIWSCGVILYILLSGVPPFWGETEQQIFQAILLGRPDFRTAPWPDISIEAKGCVQAMLQMDPKRRATAEEVLKHEWMRENGVASEQPLDNVILHRMKNFSNMNKLKKQALKFIASRLSPEEIAGLKTVFQAIDTDGSGSIIVEELKEGMQKLGSTLDAQELNELIRNLDVDNNGTIDYEEFITATLNMAQLEKEEHLRGAFQRFDTDNNGFITQDELQVALKELGTNVDEDIQDIMRQVDKDGNGKIDYEEFVDMMLSGNEGASSSNSVSHRSAVKTARRLRNFAN